MKDLEDARKLGFFVVVIFNYYKINCCKINGRKKNRIGQVLRVKGLLRDALKKKCKEKVKG